MARVRIPGERWVDPFGPKPYWRRVAVHLAKDVAAQPRETFSLLVASLVIVTFLYLGLPYVFVGGRGYGPEGSRTYTACDYFGFESFTKEGPDCPIVTWKRP